VLAVDSGDTEQEEVGGDRLGGFNRCGSARDGGVLVDAPAEQEDLDRGMVDERRGNRRAVRHHGRLKIRRQ
jgi:hypothetical protein